MVWTRSFVSSLVGEVDGVAEMIAVSPAWLKRGSEGHGHDAVRRSDLLRDGVHRSRRVGGALSVDHDGQWAVEAGAETVREGVVGTPFGGGGGLGLVAGGAQLKIGHRQGEHSEADDGQQEDRQRATQHEAGPPRFLNAACRSGDGREVLLV